MSGRSSLQLGLFGVGEVAVPHGFEGVRRVDLGGRSWLDHVPRWLGGSDALLDALAERAHWRSGRRVMYQRLVDEPRLTAWYERGEPLPHPALGELFERLSARYDIQLDSVGLNWYRNGSDSVAWHGDTVGRRGADVIVAIVSLGQPRAFQLRPATGGRSRSFLLGGGDLLVMGGACQREFEHRVPKVARAGPRLSVVFRHGAPPPGPPGPGRLSAGGRPQSSNERMRANPSATVAMRPSSWAS